MTDSGSEPGQASRNQHRIFIEDIRGKSDRAVAIIGAAVLNTHVEQLLTAFFISDETEAAALLGSDRPLGMMGARIRAAYLLGLLSEEEKEDLEAVSHISDTFTRELEEIAFTDLPIRAWCLDLNLPNKILLAGEDRKPRQMFVFTVALLMRQLALRIRRAEQDKREIPDAFSLVQIK